MDSSQWVFRLFVGVCTAEYDAHFNQCQNVSKEILS